jgi:hypothetical protein
MPNNGPPSNPSNHHVAARFVCLIFSRYYHTSLFCELPYRHKPCSPRQSLALPTRASVTMAPQGGAPQDYRIGNITRPFKTREQPQPLGPINQAKQKVLYRDEIPRCNNTARFQLFPLIESMRDAQIFLAQSLRLRLVSG